MEFALTARWGSGSALMTPGGGIMPPGSRLGIRNPEIERIHPCIACQSLARAVLEAASMFGSRVEASGGIAEQVCPDHLPLVVGYTAPRQLARWLAACLDPAPHATEPCSLCKANDIEVARFSGRSADEFRCTNHGGGNGPGPAAARRALQRIASGERLLESQERRVPRTALVLFASVRGTSVFVSRLD